MNDISQIVMSSGAIGVTIIGFGAIALGVGCVRTAQLYREAQRVDQVHRKLTLGKRINEADCWMAKGYTHAINNKALGLAEFRRLLSHHVESDLLPRLRFGRGLIGVIAGTSTTLGLLGTVFGMARSFGTVAEGGSSQQLASAIELSLSTTILGITASIPLVFLLLFHAYLASNVRTAVNAFRDSLAERVFSDLFPGS